jgi:hypothetical protein
MIPSSIFAYQVMLYAQLQQEYQQVAVEKGAKRDYLFNCLSLKLAAGSTATQGCSRYLSMGL